MASSLSLSTCALPASNPRLTLQVNIADDANHNTPVPVDLVFVWDKALTGQIRGLTAKEWFDKKAQFRLDDPTAKALTICEWEWVPGQIVSPINVMVPAAARSWVQSAFVFANYRAQGEYRYRVEPGATTVLNMLESRVDPPTVQPLGKTTKPPYVVLSSVAACNQPRDPSQK